MPSMRYLRLSVFLVFGPSVMPQNNLVEIVYVLRSNPIRRSTSPMMVSD